MMDKKNKNRFYRLIFTFVVVGFMFYLGTGLMIENEATTKVRGMIMGRYAKPTEPQQLEPVLEFFSKEKKKKVVILRIPKIREGMRMPHPYWGSCDKCHLFEDRIFSASITPYGKIMQKISTIKKVGPAILPDSYRPHPGAGRCIKCHDIVISK